MEQEPQQPGQPENEEVTPDPHLDPPQDESPAPETPATPEAPETPETPDTPEEVPAPAAPVATYAPGPSYDRGRLVRRPEGKLIAGVCTGLGAYTGVDPVAFRIGFVVLGLTTGIGLVGYLVAWLVMPMARDDEPIPVPPRQLNAGRWVGIGAIALGALVFAHTVFGFHTSWFWGALLIGLGLALWGRDWTGSGRPRPPTERRSNMSRADDHFPVTQSPPESSAATSTLPVATMPLPRAPRAPKPPKAKRPPSILGRLVVGACALAIGVSLLLSNLHVWHVGAKTILALLVGIIGVGLLLGTFWGRARWLIFPGVVLALMLTTVAAIPFNTRGGVGPVSYTPSSFTTLRRNYEHAAGPMQVDLSHLHFGGKHRTVNIRLGAGPLIVIVPKDVNVLARGHVQGGPIDIFGRSGAGWDVSNTVESKAKGSEGFLRINASVTFGPLLVGRDGDPSIQRFIDRNIHDSIDVHIKGAGL